MFKCDWCEFSCKNKYNLRRHGCYKFMTTKGRISEREIQNLLRDKIGGRPRKCPSGIVDLVIEGEFPQIVEIKCWAEYRAALGQILDYSIHFPNHIKRIHLFGRPPNEEKRKMIAVVCERYNIILTHEDF